MEHSLELLIDYLQNILEQPETATLRPEELSPDFRGLGEKIALLADAFLDLTGQLQQIGRASCRERV